MKDLTPILLKRNVRCTIFFEKQGSKFPILYPEVSAFAINSIGDIDFGDENGARRCCNVGRKIKKVVFRWELAGYLEFIPIGEDEKMQIPFELRELGVS